MCDDYHKFLIATLVFTRLLLAEIYHLIQLPFDWLTDHAMFICLLDDLIRGFCYSNLSWETSAFELASTITLVLQAKWLTKYGFGPQIMVLDISAVPIFLMETCSSWALYVNESM